MKNTIINILLMLAFPMFLPAQFTGGSGPGDNFKRQYNQHFDNWFKTDGNWSQTTNWSQNTLPEASERAWIKASANVDGNYQHSNLLIENDGRVVIPNNGKLTVTGTIINNSGVEGIHIKSDATGTGSLLHNTEGVPATIERYIPSTGYHLVSVPLTQDANPLSGLFLWSYLFEFDPATQDWIALGTPTTTPLFVNKGYMIYKYPGTDDWSSDTTYSFAGPMNNGSFTAETPMTNAGQHALVPNPYPSAIDWDALSGWTKTNLYDAIWIWNPTLGNYAAYGSEAGTNGATRYIPSGQAFFVQTSTGSPVLTMNNVVRVHNAQPFYKDEKDVADLLRVKATSNNFSDEIVVRFIPESNPGFDGIYDVQKMFGNEGSPQLYSLSADLTKLSINSLSVDNIQTVIPAGFESSVAGMCTLAVSSVSSFSPGVEILLEDLLTNITTDLRKTPEYSFIHEPGNDPLRFKLHFNNVSGVHESSQTNDQIFAQNGKIYLIIPSHFGETASVELFDMTGRRMQENDVVLSNPAFIDVNGLKGIVLLKVTVGNVIIGRILVL